MNKKQKLTITIATSLIASFIIIFLLTQTILSGIKLNQFIEDNNVSIYTRDSSSGTRNEFFSQIDFKEATNKDEFLKNPVITSSNGEMLESIKNDKYSIGFASFSSLKNASGIKQITVNNVECTEENIKNNTYPLTRKFSYLTRVTSDEKISAAIKIFQSYIDSIEGANIIEAMGGIVNKEGKSHFNDLDLETEKTLIKNKKITLNIGGSTSIAKIAGRLTRSFKAEVDLNINFKEQFTGSTDAINHTKEEANTINRLDFGFTSRELAKEEESTSFKIHELCKDGISIIINEKNKVKDLGKKELKDIYSKNKKWSDYHDFY